MARYYIDQVDRSLEHLRVPISGGVPARLTTGLPTLNAAGVLALPNGRFVYATEIAGRPRLVIGRPGQELVPFVETQEQARAPMARLSDREFVFVGGTRDTPVLAIASSETGRIVRRLESTRGRQVTRLAVSSDGGTVYFAAGGIISTVPAGGGEVGELTRGNGVAPDPLGRFLVIDRQDANGSQILRRDNNGTETPIKLPVVMRATGLSVWPTSLDARGRLLFVAETDDSWFWGPAVLDLQTHQATRIPMTYAGMPRCRRRGMVKITSPCLRGGRRARSGASSARSSDRTQTGGSRRDSAHANQGGSAHRRLPSSSSPQHGRLGRASATLRGEVAATSSSPPTSPRMYRDSDAVRQGFDVRGWRDSCARSSVARRPSRRRERRKPIHSAAHAADCSATNARMEVWRPSG